MAAHGDASEAMVEHLAALDAAAELQRDVVQRVGRLEEASTSTGRRWASRPRSAWRRARRSLRQLKQALDDNERAARDRGPRARVGAGRARDALETNHGVLRPARRRGRRAGVPGRGRRLEERAIADAIPKRVDAVRDRVAALEESATEPPSTPGRESLRRYAESPHGHECDDAARQRCADLERKARPWNAQRARRRPARAARTTRRSKARAAMATSRSLALRVDDVSATGQKRLSGSGASPRRRHYCDRGGRRRVPT